MVAFSAKKGKVSIKASMTKAVNSAVVVVSFNTADASAHPDDCHAQLCGDVDQSAVVLAMFRVVCAKLTGTPALSSKLKISGIRCCSHDGCSCVAVTCASSFSAVRRVIKAILKFWKIASYSAYAETIRACGLTPSRDYYESAAHAISSKMSEVDVFIGGRNGIATSERFDQVVDYVLKGHGDYTVVGKKGGSREKQPDPYADFHAYKGSAGALSLAYDLLHSKAVPVVLHDKLYVPEKKVDKVKSLASKKALDTFFRATVGGKDSVEVLQFHMAMQCRANASQIAEISSIPPLISEVSSMLSK